MSFIAVEPRGKHAMMRLVLRAITLLDTSITDVSGLPYARASTDSDLGSETSQDIGSQKESQVC